MTAAHSPLPWKQVGSHIIDANGEHIIAADAALIVRAVNALEPMREALKMAQVYCKAQAEDSKSQFFLQQQAYADLKIIDAALALASGTTEETK